MNRLSDAGSIPARSIDQLQTVVRLQLVFFAIKKFLFYVHKTYINLWYITDIENYRVLFA